MPKRDPFFFGHSFFAMGLAGLVGYIAAWIYIGAQCLSEPPIPELALLGFAIVAKTIAQKVYASWGGRWITKKANEGGLNVSEKDVVQNGILLKGLFAAMAASAATAILLEKAGLHFVSTLLACEVLGLVVAWLEHWSNPGRNLLRRATNSSVV